MKVAKTMFRIILIMILILILTNIFCKKKYDRYDVNRDGEINSKDYMVIKNYIMNNKE